MNLDHNIFYLINLIKMIRKNLMRQKKNNRAKKMRHFAQMDEQKYE